MLLRAVGGAVTCALSLVFLGLIAASMAKQSRKVPGNE
tara:strand:+ start:459 stop:572 length:114 start_codon:yes stop_codon:yes gene_type:complete